MHIPQWIVRKAVGIRVLICDVDGVLTDGVITFMHDGQTAKSFFAQDGIGFSQLLAVGVRIAIISGHYADCVDTRMHQLGVETVFQGVKDKRVPYEQIKGKWQVEDEAVAYVGDDLPDLPLIQQAGLGIAVPNAIPCVKQSADWMPAREGGKGAVRDICDMLLLARTRGEADSP